MSDCFLGIDVGTSGIRASVIDDNASEILTLALPLRTLDTDDGVAEADASEWRQTLDALLRQLSQQLNRNWNICAIAIDGTSGTLLACDADGNPLGPALMYNDSQSTAPAEKIATVAPPESGAHGASSSLAKAITLLQRYPQTSRFCHQADWLMAGLTGEYGVSDENNCLKLGYDIVRRNWPAWINSLGIERSQLPEVVAPGSFIATVLPARAAELGLPADCRVIAGTTDSIAAVIATGASHIGEGVTSLGSTLVVKLFSRRPLFAAEYGIYSHRLDEHWLVGGASNAGGTVLRRFFSQQQLDRMTPELQPEKPTGLHYYPLPSDGERFPVNDSRKQPVLTPRPDNDVVFFQAMLEGLSAIEQQGYEKLAELGAGRVKKVFTCGGGDNNPAWRKIRQQKLGVPVVSAKHTQASYGSARLARKGWRHLTGAESAPGEFQPD
ncbi:MAG TPA: carbohydrate kinase [Thiotrichales bacterium]|nr:carbohydrate kinase [Thiotrichales bacterium]